MRLILSTGFFLFTLISMAQAVADFGTTTYLYKNESDIAAGKKTGYYVGPHILGDTITMLLNKFESEYVYFEESGGAYSVEEKKFLKPEIYKAVSRINKYYEKGVKKNKITEKDAYEKLKGILMVGIKLKGYQTSEVEKQLASIKELSDQEQYLLSLQYRN